MKSHQTRGLQAFRRIEAWFAEHPQVIAASGTSSAALSNQVDALKQIVASMTARATEQASQTGQATLAAKDESSDTLFHAAEAIRTTAAVYKDVFVEHGLPADFLDQLDAATTALEASVDARGVARAKVSGASSGLVSDLSLGRQIVTMIDASLSHALKADSPMLASWRQAKRATVKGATSRAVVGAVPLVGNAVSPTNGGGATQGNGVPVASSVELVPHVVTPEANAGESPTLGTVTPTMQQESRAA
jgi:hypothetical protein